MFMKIKCSYISFNETVLADGKCERCVNDIVINKMGGVQIIN
jgi:transcription initiation factor IIE alpha subunit